jgi:hypothetical protein
LRDLKELIQLRMIQPGSKNNLISGVRLSHEPYLIINMIFAGVIILIMIYSGIFSPVTNNYPVVCIHEKLTGQPCASCGLSHSFSLILRGHIGEARQWNVYGPRVFLFFFSQLLLRMGFSVYYLLYPLNRRQLIITDIAGSTVLFFLAFTPYIKWTFVNLF